MFGESDEFVEFYHGLRRRAIKKQVVVIREFS